MYNLTPPPTWPTRRATPRQSRLWSCGGARPTFSRTRPPRPPCSVAKCTRTAHLPSPVVLHPPPLRRYRSTRPAPAGRTASTRLRNSRTFRARTGPLATGHQAALAPSAPWHQSWKRKQSWKQKQTRDRPSSPPRAGAHQVAPSVLSVPRRAAYHPS